MARASERIFSREIVVAAIKDSFPKLDPRLQLKIAKNNRQISDVQFQQTVENTVAGVKQMYYDLLYAIDNLEAQRKSLSLAQKLVGENRIKVRVGTMAPLDVVEAESEQASREEAVILAEAAVLDAEDAIKRAIFPKSDAAMWSLRIVPTDRPTAEAVPVDVEAAIQKALVQRTDLMAARKNLETAGLNVKYASNQKLPGLDFVAGYGASGTGGTQFVRDSPLGPIVQTIPGGYGDALSTLFGRDFPTWNIGVNFSYPLFNRTAEATSARAKLSQQQAEESLGRLEMQVTAEVRSAGRAVETNFKRVASTRAARVLQERRLDAEQKKFAAGMSTNFSIPCPPSVGMTVMLMRRVYVCGLKMLSRVAHVVPLAPGVLPAAGMTYVSLICAASGISLPLRPRG